jgi:hypothetical protein
MYRECSGMCRRIVWVIVTSVSDEIAIGILRKKGSKT